VLPMANILLSGSSTPRTVPSREYHNGTVLRKTPEESDDGRTPVFYRLILTFRTGIITVLHPESHPGTATFLINTVTTLRNMTVT